MNHIYPYKMKKKNYLRNLPKNKKIIYPAKISRQKLGRNQLSRQKIRLLNNYQFTQ